MVDRILLATAVLAHCLLAAAFVLTDGPQSSRVILKLSTTHGVHASDVPINLIWTVGIAALAGLWYRHGRNP
ncbi:hypothetical protein [Nocardioides sp.]|uniref:hypothetical protein n=1 Tax=Nocardioides sp. TaxID=35761 RepID=UPI0027196FF5|nr:hypothetical protein [Nocardioides sp.]MDO9454939.1 hypothetical protein [Nocardioides sp.]